MSKIFHDQDFPPAHVASAREMVHHEDRIGKCSTPGAICSRRKDHEDLLSNNFIQEFVKELTVPKVYGQCVIDGDCPVEASKEELFQVHDGAVFSRKIPSNQFAKN